MAAWFRPMLLATGCLASPLAAQPVGPGGASRARLSLRDIPGVVITYYDVAGFDIRHIHQSLLRNAPRDPATRRPLPAQSSWSIRAAAKTRTTGASCRIERVDVQFVSAATLPRLTTIAQLPLPIVTSWTRYRDALEARQAKQLLSARAGVDTVRTAVERSGCETWQRAATTAIDQLEQRLAFDAKTQSVPQPMLLEPNEDLPDPSKLKAD